MTLPRAWPDPSALEAVLVDAVGATDVPSLKAAVAHGADPVWRTTIGRDHSQYRIGSITKTFTAVLVMRLRDEGRLDLGDTLRQHLPDTPFGTATVRTLLSHSSGLPAEPAGDWWERSPGTSWTHLASANEVRDLVFRPGQRYHYSNLAFALLGQLVAQLRKAAWFDVLSDELLVPLRLASTTERPLPGAAPGTSRNPLDGTVMAEVVQETGAMAPAGQLWSTVDDLSTWAGFLVDGHPGVLAAATLLEMRTVQAGDPYDQHVGAYGLGLRLRWSGQGTLVGHSGSMPGYLAALFVDPATRISAALLSNVTTGLALEDCASRLIESATTTMPRASDTDGAGGLASVSDPSLEGRWFWGNTEMSLRLTESGLQLGGDSEMRDFERIEADRYRGLNGYFAGEVLSVERTDAGEVSHLEVVTFVLTRRPYDENAPIPGGQPTQLA